MGNAQVFVKINEYKDVLDTIGMIKDKLHDAKNTLNKLNDLKSREDSEINSWGQKIDEVENKIEEIDHKLLAPEE